MRFSCDPKVWGSPAWVFLHSIALCYPEHPTETDKHHYKMFFLSLGYVLPCLDCQEHLLKWLSRNSKKFENAFTNRTSLSKFIIDMHNAVNIRLHKPIFKPTYSLK